MAWLLDLMVGAAIAAKQKGVTKREDFNSALKLSNPEKAGSLRSLFWRR